MNMAMNSILVKLQSSILLGGFGRRQLRDILVSKDFADLFLFMIVLIRTYHKTDTGNSCKGKNARIECTRQVSS